METLYEELENHKNSIQQTKELSLKEIKALKVKLDELRQ